MDKIKEPLNRIIEDFELYSREEDKLVVTLQKRHRSLIKGIEDYLANHKGVFIAEWNASREHHNNFSEYYYKRYVEQ